MGLSDSGLAAVGKSIDQTLLELVDAMMNEDAELITLYYGSDISEEDAENAAAKVEEKYPDIPVHSLEAERKLAEKERWLTEKQRKRNIRHLTKPF